MAVSRKTAIKNRHHPPLLASSNVLKAPKHDPPAARKLQSIVMRIGLRVDLLAGSSGNALGGLVVIHSSAD
jgi:hypothetical protein